MGWSFFGRAQRAESRQQEQQKTIYPPVYIYSSAEWKILSDIEPVSLSMLSRIESVVNDPHWPEAMARAEKLTGKPYAGPDLKEEARELRAHIDAMDAAPRPSFNKELGMVVHIPALEARMNCVESWGKVTDKLIKMAQSDEFGFVVGMSQLEPKLPLAVLRNNWEMQAEHVGVVLKFLNSRKWPAPRTDVPFVVVPKRPAAAPAPRP